MLQRPNKPRLPLKRALRRYWPWLACLVASGVVIFLVPGVRWPLEAPLFLVGAFVALWPVLKLDAPYSFWVVGCVLYFFVPFVIGAIIVLSQG